MPAGKADLYIEQGADWLVTIFLYQDKQQIIPFDLTGYNVEMQIRKEAGSCNITAAPAISIVDAASGKIECRLTSAETQAIPVRGRSYDEMTDYVYDMYIKKAPDGARRRVLNGYVHVSPGVTHNEE